MFCAKPENAWTLDIPSERSTCVSPVLRGAIRVPFSKGVDFAVLDRARHWLHPSMRPLMIGHYYLKKRDYYGFDEP
jgi:hypothetical protein